jgi:hypothetical protein
MVSESKTFRLCQPQKKKGMLFLPAGVFEALRVETPENLVIGIGHDGGKAAERTLHQVCNARLTNLFLLHFAQHLKHTEPQRDKVNATFFTHNVKIVPEDIKGGL